MEGSNLTTPTVLRQELTKSCPSPAQPELAPGAYLGGAGGGGSKLGPPHYPYPFGFYLYLDKNKEGKGSEEWGGGKRGGSS